MHSLYMANVFTNIQELKAELQSLQPMLPEYQQRLDKKFRLEFSYNSNHLEGNTLTYSETTLLLFFEKTQGQHEVREYDEMRGHDVAFKIVKELASEKERPLTEAIIKNLNGVILVKPFWKNAKTTTGDLTRRLIKIGDYKEQPNHVELPNGDIFEYSLPSETPIKMGELTEWYRIEEEKQELPPVALAALLHYKFVRIHPFDDGNGRISRLLMNYVLLKNDLPPIVIRSASKKEYLFALKQADAGDLNAFVNYVAEQLVWSLELSIKAAKGESIEEADDIDKEIEIFKKGIDRSKERKNKKDWDSIKQLFVDSAISLFKAAEEKLLKFKDLFFVYESKFGFQLDDDKNDSLNFIDGNSLTKDWINEFPSTEKVGMKRFGYLISLKGYKPKEKPDVLIFLSFELHDYSFEIVGNSGVFPDFIRIKMDYGETLSENKIQEITNTMARRLMEVLK